VLLTLLNRTIDGDRYPLSPRMRTLREIRAPSCPARRQSTPGATAAKGQPRR
jgi:hypothetical protein